VKDLTRIKYIIINHLEPDHQSSTPRLLELAPDAKILISKAGPKIAQSFYDFPQDRVIPVNDNDRISLGNKTLRFIIAPWLHWPETMMTYEEEDEILFTTDVFGSYGWVKDGMFDDEIDMERYRDEAKRYYINIIGKYNKYTLAALEKIKDLNIKIIAPSHGPIYRKNVKEIIENYRKWANPELKDVAIIYASMYGHMNTITNYIEKRLTEKNIPVRRIDLVEKHPSYVLSETNESLLFVFGIPTYDASVFMPLQNMLYVFKTKDLGHHRPAAIINTYGWTPIIDLAKETVKNSGFEILEPAISIKASPRGKDAERLDELIEKVIEKYYSITGTHEIH
ncbi:MAG: FprA family A-type flavoprotein, partial [Thermoplasmata archaeon]